MFDLFAAAPVDVRKARLADYRQYLVERDGEVNLHDMTLSRREAAMKRFETPPALSRRLDEAQFRANYASFDKKRPPTEEMTLLLALVKTNAAEAYGVSRSIQKAMQHALRSDDDVELRILVEESYHTRILLSSANHYGLQVTDAYHPPSALRIMIGGIAGTPPSISRPLVLASEILGTLLFVKLLDVTRRVLKHDAETRDAIEERLVEICTDERGHISYNRMLSGSAALAQTRLILPLVSRGLANVLPEVVALGAYPTDLWRELPLLADPKRLPEVVRRQSFVA
ncbi:MAG TPA: hypothetical protein VJV78_39210 [Polyangiales bacterium]|nr:hypothetical protein [Polyangiales bacterium]